MECSLKRVSSLWLLLSLQLISSAAIKELKATIPECNKNNGTLSCNLHNITEETRFNNDNWEKEGVGQVLITGAKSISLIKQYAIDTLKWNFTNCGDVRVDRSVDSSVYSFGFTDSKVSVLTPETVSVLKSTNSSLGKVNIQTNNQFDFVSSSIEDFSIHVTGKKTTILNSNVMRIRNMVLEGDFQFLLESSRVDQVDKLEIKLTSLNSRIFDSTFGTVGMEGLKLRGDQFSISSTNFNNLASKAIVVHTHLTIENCKIGRFQIDSFKVQEGSIVFNNVQIGDKNVSFAIRNVSGGYFPLAALFPEHAQSKVNLALGVGIPVSLVAGILCGAALTYFILQRRQNGQSQDNLKLLPETKVEAYRLPSQPPPATPIVQHETVLESKDDGDDIYEEYQDVNVNVPSPPSSVNLLPVSNNVGNVPPPKLPPQLPSRSDLPAPPGRHPVPPPQNRDGLSPKGGLPTPPQPSLAGPPPPLAASPKPSVLPLPPKVTAATPPTFGNKPEATPTVTQPSDSSPDDNDLELYDEVNEGTPVSQVPPSPMRPQILAKKPSFLHNAPKPKPPLPPSDTDKTKVPPTITKPKPGALPDGKFRLPQWPPTVPLKPPPPPGELKPSSASNSLEEDENDIYEEIPE